MVAGDCPEGYDRRLPQIQLFVRIKNYQGKKYRYTLSDESNVFHVDFMNGWKEGALQKIIDECPIEGEQTDYNPPCNCDGPNFLTPNENASRGACDSDVRNFILDEATDVVNALPRGGCNGNVIEKSWTEDPPFTCKATNDCGNNKNRKECIKNEECTWNKNDKLCEEACSGEDCEATECSDITDKKICKKTEGCAYDKKGKVCMDKKESLECGDITNRKKCMKAKGCMYDKKEKVCVDKKKPLECGKITNKKKCMKAKGCMYDKKEKVCMEEYTPMPLCEVFDKKWKCKKA